MEKVASFRDRLEVALKIKGVTGALLAKRVGLTKSTVSHYLRERHYPALPIIDLIAAELRVSPVWLMGYNIPADSAFDVEIIDLTIGQEKFSISKRDFLKLLGERIRERRVALSMSQDELTTKCGFSTWATITDIEYGECDISVSQIAVIAKALNLPPEELTKCEVPEYGLPLGEINERILRLVKDRGLTLSEFAGKIGSNIISIARWSEKNKPITGHYLRNICNVLDTNQMYIINGTNPDDFIWSRISNTFSILNVGGKITLLRQAEYIAEIPKYILENADQGEETFEDDIKAQIYSIFLGLNNAGRNELLNRSIEIEETPKYAPKKIIPLSTI